MPRVVVSALLLALTPFATACAHAPPATLVEDRARRDVPIAICRAQLNATDTTEAGLPKPEVYWKTLFPRFGGFGSAMDLRTPDCIGDALALIPGVASSTPSALSKDDLTAAPGENGLQAAWLRASTSNAVGYGLLALVRPRPAELDVYALGFYQGSARHSRFELAKLGPATILVARDEACADVKPGAECESTLSFYVAAAGKLTVGAKTMLQRTLFGTMKDVGRVQSRFTTDPPVVEGETIKVKEKLSVRDSGDDEVRKSEGERIFTLRGTELVANKDSIWAAPPR
jgi:hypothetical protein